MTAQGLPSTRQGGPNLSGLLPALLVFGLPRDAALAADRLRVPLTRFESIRGNVLQAELELPPGRWRLWPERGVALWIGRRPDSFPAKPSRGRGVDLARALLVLAGAGLWPSELRVLGERGWTSVLGVAAAAKALARERDARAVFGVWSDVAGGMLLYRTPQYEPERVASALARIELRQKMRNARPYQVLVVGSDTLNGLAETFSQFGMPESFFWPASRTNNGVWAQPCPPGQLGRGLVVYRSKKSGTVLWMRGSLHAVDVPMLVDLAYMVGDIDLVAVTELTTEERRMIERQWQRAAKDTRARGKGRLPKAVHALDLSRSTMRPFDRLWSGSPSDEDEAGESVDEATRVRMVPAARAVPNGRRVVESDYPLPARLADAVRRKARLGSARSALAAEGIVCFAEEFVGIVTAFEEGLLLPAGCRRVADALDLNISTAVRGFRVERIPAAQLSLAPTEPPLSDFVRLAGSTVRERLGAKDTELLCLEDARGRWPHRLLLCYERVVDIDGGARVVCPSHVELYARAAGDAVELAVLTRRASDGEAARAWLQELVSRFDDHWIPQPLGLPYQEPERSESLRALLTMLAGHQVVGVGQPAGVRDQLRTIASEDEFSREMLAADYKTRAISVEAALRRIESDHNAFASLVAYLWGAQTKGPGAPVVMLELRQTLKDPQLALTWKGGGQSGEADTAELTVLRNWDAFRALDWQDERKREFVLEAFADVADRLRDAAETAALQLSA